MFSLLLESLFVVVVVIIVSSLMFQLVVCLFCCFFKVKYPPLYRCLILYSLICLSICVCLSQWLNMVIRFKLELEHNKALKLILQIFQKSFLTFFEVRWSRVVKLEWNGYISFRTTSFGLKFYSKTGFSSINNIFVQMFVNLFLVFCTMGKTTNRGKGEIWSGLMWEC